VLVPATDEDGNELGGIRMPRVGVPLATYTGWNYLVPRLTDYEQLGGLYGSILPFTRSEQERDHSTDTRLSIFARYPDRAAYLARVREEADRLTAARFLRLEDVSTVVEDAALMWDAIVARPAASGSTAGSP
jgi:hypothetical protein